MAHRLAPGVKTVLDSFPKQSRPAGCTTHAWIFLRGRRQRTTAGVRHGAGPIVITTCKSTSPGYWPD